MTVPLLEHVEKDGFRLRGLEMSRIDGFSDVVFGFALTLLVVSLEVPHTYSELQQSLRGFFPFAVSFVFLMLVWFAHYKYFRRFGTHDAATIAINAALLFVVLFYVYPLKFLMTFLLNALMGSPDGFFQKDQQVRELMVLFGIGFASVYFLLAALYANGLRQRSHLQLNELEEALTHGYIVESAGTGAIGLLSCLAAILLPVAYSGLSGWIYMLIYAFKVIHRRHGRRLQARRAALRKLTDTPH